MKLSALASNFRWNSGMQNLSARITLVDIVLVDVPHRANMYLPTHVQNRWYLTRISQRYMYMFTFMWEYVCTYANVYILIGHESSMHEQICRCLPFVCDSSNSKLSPQGSLLKIITREIIGLTLGVKSAYHACSVKSVVLNFW